MLLRACKSGDRFIETWVSARITATMPPDSPRYEDALTPQLVSWIFTAPAASHPFDASYPRELHVGAF